MDSLTTVPEGKMKIAALARENIFLARKKKVHFLGNWSKSDHKIGDQFTTINHRKSAPPFCGIDYR